MPYYYHATRASTTNASANTCTTHLQARTVTNGRTARMTALSVGGRPTNSTAGAAEIRYGRLDQQGSGGTALVLNCSSWGSPVPTLTLFSDASGFGTTGGATTYHNAIAFAQTGGNNGWVALEPDDALHLNHSTNTAAGNLVVDSFATATSAGLIVSITINE
jgi:hypothetical protein